MAADKNTSRPNDRRQRPRLTTPVGVCNHSADLIQPDQLFEAKAPPSAISVVREYFLHNGMLWNHIPEGQTLLRVGDPCRNICYVITGLVKLGTLSPGGSEVLLALRGANTVLGYETVMLNAKLPFCAMSLTRCDVAFVHTNQFKQDLIRLPDLAPSMQTILSEQALTFMRRVYELTAEPAESRLISTILSLAGQLSVPASRTYTRIDIKNRELANLVSITPEHLSRLLCQLKKNGLVDRQQGWLIVPDLLRLAEYLASYDSRDGGL